MDATNKIIVLAKELGEALKESKEYTDFCDAKKAMRENTVLKAKPFLHRRSLNIPYLP